MSVATDVSGRLASRWRDLLIAAQGLWVRRRLEILPPAAGATMGRVWGPDEKTPFRFVVVGDSTAAGCGADSHREGFAGTLGELLAHRLSRPVEWAVIGEYGATARRVRHRLLARITDNFDLAVVLVGANDVLAARASNDWAEDLQAILDVLHTRTRLIAVLNTPPFERFPALPKALGGHLAERGDHLDRISAAICLSTPKSQFVSIDDDTVESRFFARDGFHPSTYGYQSWADEVAKKLRLR